MASPCNVVYKGKEIPYDEFLAMLHDGLLEDLVNKDIVDTNKFTDLTWEANTQLKNGNITPEQRDAILSGTSNPVSEEDIASLESKAEDAEKLGKEEEVIQGADAIIGDAIPPIAEPPAEPGAAPAKPLKKSGFQERSIERAEGPEAEEVRKVARENEVLYEEMNQKEQYDQAVQFFTEAGDGNIVAGVEKELDSLFPKQVSLDEAAELQVKRQVAMQITSREMSRNLLAGNEREAQRWYNKTNRLQEALSKDFAKGGQIGAMAVWRFMTADSIVYNLKQKIKEQNEKVKDSMSKEEKQQVEELINKVEKLTAKIEEEMQKTAGRAKAKAAKTAEKAKTEKAKAEAKAVKDADRAKRRQELRNKFLPRFNDITSMVTLLADKEFIEYGKILIQDGATDFKSFANEAVKELGVKVKPILAKWYQKASGQSVLDAESQKAISEYMQKEFGKQYGQSKLPRPIRKKTMFDKLIEGANSGVVNDEFYKNLFFEKFGMMTPMTLEQEVEFQKLADAVTELPPTSRLYNKAVMEMAQWVEKNYPRQRWQNMTDLWVAMNYAQMLSGISTHIVNITSTGSGIISSPFRNAVNMSKWLRAIREAGKDKSFATFKAYNPLYETIYTTAAWVEGAKEGATIFGANMSEGAIGNKYVESVTNSSDKVNVPTLEQNKYGEGKRFRPLNIKIGGKKIDLNPYNALKYVPRSLAAEDAFMYQTVYEQEVAGLAFDIYRKQGLRGKELTKAVIDVYKKANANKALAQEQLDKEVAIYERSGKKASEKDKKIRLSELIADQVMQNLGATKDQLEEARKIASSQTFNDDRTGVISRLSQLMGMTANYNRATQIFIKPWVPFTKVVGNVTEYMLDSSPYGFARANGWSVSGIANRISKGLGNEGFGTAQMGEAKSRAYYEQMGRAWLGTVAMATLGMMFLGTDEDDYIQITGGYDEETKKKKYGRAKITPKYSIRIGDDFVISYLNIPQLAIPLGLIGNYNDYKNIHKYSDEEANDRMALALSVIGNTVTMAKDMSFVEGVQSLSEAIANVASAEGTKMKQAAKEVFKQYAGFVTRPLPQNNNMLLQVEKFFDPVSYTNKEIKDITAYSLGIQHFVGHPSVDLFGDKIKSYPAENVIPYTHWFDLQSADSDWRYLARYNAIPAKFYNNPVKVYNPTTEEYEVRSLESKEFYDFCVLTGKKFREKLHEYQNDVDAEERVKEKKQSMGKVYNGVEYDISELLSEAKEEAKYELFETNTPFGE